MSPRVAMERDALMELLSGVLGDLVQAVTDDVQAARASPGRVAVFIEPPDLDYPRWDGKPEITWRVDVVAGTMATQATGLDLIMRAIDLLAAAGLNIQTARPVTMSLAGAGPVAAYQLTLNPLELIEEE